MRLIQIWVPDLRDPKVRAEMRRLCEAVNEAERADPGTEHGLPPYDWGSK